MLYADEDTEHSRDKDPDQLVVKIQFEADCATTWVADNKLVCSGGKTKLLIVTTTAMRLTRLVGRKLQISVCGAPVIESECEKIIGILANNKLTWFHHLYGDKSDPNKPQPGLIPLLAKRVGNVHVQTPILSSTLRKCLGHRYNGRRRHSSKRIYKTESTQFTNSTK